MDETLLRSVSILRNLDTDELHAFASLFQPRSASRGEVLLREGTVVTSFSIICSGIVHVRRLAQKREILMGRLGPGAFFGEINLFDPGVATASIYAMKAVQLAVCDYESLRAFLSANPATGYKIVSAMMEELCKRMRNTSARLVNSLYWTSQEGAAQEEA